MKNRGHLTMIAAAATIVVIVVIAIAVLQFFNTLNFICHIPLEYRLDLYSVVVTKNMTSEY